jgi:hypothetical protein
MRKSREKSDTVWKAHHNNDETFWNSRIEANTEWKDNWRDKRKTRSRNYMLGSFFTQVLTAITDTKDWKAIRIKTDPRYIRDSEFMNRKEKDTSWKVRFRS